jgi:hypothetical protein
VSHGREKLVSKRVLFLHDHKAQADWANIDNQVIASVGGVTLPPRFASIQSLRFRPLSHREKGLTGRQAPTKTLKDNLPRAKMENFCTQS